jgi:ActR/RegA family two-component response regulator
VLWTRCGAIGIRQLNSTQLNSTDKEHAVDLPTVLVVDDDVRIVRMFERLLPREGFRVASTQTVAEALELIPQVKPQYAVIDLVLGSGEDAADGSELVTVCAQNGIDCVVVTGFATVDVTNTLRDMGARAVIPKPVFAAEVAAALRGDGDQTEDFDDQATDPEWAQRAEKAMFDSTASPAFRGAELEEAECRRTLCRAVVTFEDHHARERFPQVIDLEPWTPWTHGGFVRDHEDGKIEVFVVREGHALPTPSPEQ